MELKPLTRKSVDREQSSYCKMEMCVLGGVGGERVTEISSGIILIETECNRRTKVE